MATANTTTRKRATKTESAVETAAAVEVENAEVTVEAAVKNEKAIEKEHVVEKEPVKPLSGSDIIEVVSLIPNVSYLDKPTDEFLKWESVGDTVSMTFDMVQNMWRSHKGYFKNMRLKPLDERVIKKFDLNRIYEKYEFLMDGKNYTKANVDEIMDAISSTPNALRLSLIGKMKTLVASGEVSNATVIKAIDRKMGLDLLSFVE